MFHGLAIAYTIMGGELGYDARIIMEEMESNIS